MLCEVVTGVVKPRDGDIVYADISNIRFAYPPGCIFSSRYTTFVYVKDPLPKVTTLKFKRENGVEVADPNYVVVDFGDDFLVLPKEVWEKVNSLISTYITEGTVRGGILFYGVPGTGKSYIATKLIARVLGLKPIVKQPTDFMSKYVGEPYQMLLEFLDQTILSDRPNLVVFDEGERLLYKRSSGGYGGIEEQIENNMKNIMLTKLQQFMDTERPSLLIFTTNASINDMDDALLRRFPWKVVFPPYSPTAYEYIARRITTQREFEINKKKYDIQKLAFYASAIGLSVAEFRTIITTGNVSFLKAKTTFPRRLVPYEPQDKDKIIDISMLPMLQKYEIKGKNVKLLSEGALYTTTAVLASYFITVENRPVYLIDVSESAIRYGSDDIISLLKQDNKPVGIIHLHGVLNTAKELIIERLLEEDNISFVVTTSFGSSMLRVMTTMLLPRFDVMAIPISERDFVRKLVYTVKTFYGLPYDEAKLVNEILKTGEMKKGIDLLEKLIMISV